MATIRVYLDTRRIKMNGEYPVKIVVNHAKDIMISTDLTASKSQFENGKFKKSPNSMAKNASLASELARIQGVILDLERAGKLKLLNDKQLKSMIENFGEAEVDFFRAFRDYTATRTAERTREIYQYTLEIVEEYDSSVTFHSIDRAWLSKFETHLAKKGMKTNSIGIHLRNIRAVFNYAIDDNPTIPYPFRKFKIKKEKTPHRNSDVEEIRRILNYKGKYESFKDFFMLSFYLVGMNLKDILYMKKSHYSKGRITYRRNKTLSLYDIKVEPEAAELFEKYKSDDDYLLSFIHMYKDYAGFKRGVNYALKKLSDDQGVINEKLSTYYARHSWATIAASIDIPKETISAALGHSIGSEITSIYINFDKRKVDEANRRVIDLVG